jgi:D-threo-aldose 1-dehydrogenase
MQTRHLPGTQIETTMLGFGCAGLMRHTSAAGRLRVLSESYDAGIRHFDVARIYGLGRVEGIVGDFLRGKRDQVSIATKLGIMPNVLAQGLGGLQGVIRGAMNWTPALKRFLRRRQTSLYRATKITTEDARKSLEMSLRELKTDYVDILLYHECSVDAAREEDMLRFFEDAVASGKARAFGVATRVAETIEICRQAPAFARVVQTAGDLFRQGTSLIPEDPARAIITHSVLSGVLGPIRELLDSDPARRSALSGELGLDFSDPQTVASLLLLQALRENPHGIVLFHSGDADRIRANVLATTDPRFDSRGLDRFSEWFSAALKLEGSPR